MKYEGSAHTLDRIREGKLFGPGSVIQGHEGIDQIVKSLQAAGQFTDRKVTFDEVADDHIAKEVAKELGYKVP